MSYITEIFERANIQQIRSFLQSGAEDDYIKDKTYKQRITESCKPLNDFLENLKSSELDDMVGNALYAYENVYLEIGMQCGFMLAMEIYNKNE